MTNEMTIAGFTFEIEGCGFGRTRSAEGDFQVICVLVADHLAALEIAEISRLHAGAIIDDEGYPADDVASEDLGRIARSACREVTKDWNDPSGVFVTICAWPT